MTCVDVRRVLDDLIDGEFGANEARAVREHVDGCPGCAREFDERRAWSGAIRDALEGGLEGAEPAPAARVRAAEALAASSRKRSTLLSRAAAAAAIAFAVGLGAVAVGLSKPPAEQVTKVAGRLAERRAVDAEVRRLEEESARDVTTAREMAAARPDPGLEAASRAFDAAPSPAVERLSVEQTVDGSTVKVVQYADGRVAVDADRRRVEARSVAELLSGHAELCRRWKIGGTDGAITVGSAAAGLDGTGRLDMLFRKGTWDPGLAEEAYRAWLAPRSADARELERRAREFAERMTPKSGGPLRVELDAVLPEVRKLTRRELERTQERVEAELRALEAKLKSARDQRARAHGLRAFAEEAARDR